MTTPDLIEISDCVFFLTRGLRHLLHYCIALRGFQGINKSQPSKPSQPSKLSQPSKPSQPSQPPKLFQLLSLCFNSEYVICHCVVS